MFEKIKTSPRNSTNYHLNAPLLARTQSKINNDPPILRNFSKLNNIPLQGDPNWDVNYSQKGTALKWTTKFFFK